MGVVSDEHGERFHQNISQTEKRYSGKWNPIFWLTNSCSLIMEIQTGENERQKKSKRVFNEFFSSWGAIYKDIVDYLVLYIVIRSQYRIFLLQM